MKKILFPFLITVILASCEKSYTYVEIIEKENIIGEIERIEKEPEKIYSISSDSTAYLEGLENFLIAVKVSSDIKNTFGHTDITPLNFRIEDRWGRKLENPISIKNRDSIESIVQEKVNKLPDFSRIREIKGK